MTAKQTVPELLDRLPDDCSLDDVIEHLHVVSVVATGRREAADGQTLPHDDVDLELRRRWVLGRDE